MIDEEAIIKQAQKDKRKFALVFEEYYSKIYAYVYSYVKNKENAEDITSISFEKALKGIDTFQWEGISIQSWLYKIARNSINDFYRKKSNREPAVSFNQKIGSDNSINATFEDMVASTEVHIEEQIISSEEEDRLYNILKYFSAEDQYILYFKYFESMNNKEISKATGLSETNVGTKLQRLRLKIKNLLESI